MNTHHVDVLIAGAGPVGLAAAIELGHRGVSCLVVERNDRVGYSPRAKTSNVRTREHLRRWGIADHLRNASPMSPDYPPHVVFATRMNGHLLARFENAFNGMRKHSNLYSEEAQWVPQYVLEEVLRAHAVSLPGVEIRFNTELTQFVDDPETGINATLKDVTTGQETAVASHYLIGADGARSFVRETIGAKMVGGSSATLNFNLVFRAPDLSQRHSFGKAIMYWMVNKDVPCLMGPMDEKDLWFMIATKLPQGVNVDSIDAVDLVRRSTGLMDLDVEVVRTDPWMARCLVADTYNKGHVYLAGDACHLHPPFGGFGMNMGIGDAVDLGWKIAATLQRWGGPNLLASYEPERRPVHERTIREAAGNYASVGNQLVQEGLEDEGPLGDATRREVSDVIEVTKLREFRTLGLVLGATFADSPIVVPDGKPLPAENALIYVPSANPGALAPHLWLADGTSLYDHFGMHMSLLVTQGDEAAAFAQAAPLRAAAAARHLGLKIVSPNDPRLRARYEARFALIRPDHYVAWRGDALPDDPAALLAHVMGG